MLGPLISAGANLVGGFIGQENAEDERHRQNTVYWQNVQREENARAHAIRTRVEDARESGIHPLYALGASVPTYSPVSIGGVSGNPMGAALAAAGQDVSRALMAGESPKGRLGAASEAMQVLQVENAQLQNELLKSQIAKMNAQLGPATPSVPGGAEIELKEGKQDDVTPLAAANRKLAPHRGWSDGQTFEDRWGEWGGSAAGLAVMAADLIKAAREQTRVRPSDEWTWLPRIRWNERR